MSVLEALDPLRRGATGAVARVATAEDLAAELERLADEERGLIDKLGPALLDEDAAAVAEIEARIEAIHELQGDLRRVIAAREAAAREQAEREARRQAAAEAERNRRLALTYSRDYYLGWIANLQARMRLAELVAAHNAAIAELRPALDMGALAELEQRARRHGATDLDGAMLAVEPGAPKEQCLALIERCRGRLAELGDGGRMDGGAGG